MSGVIEVNQGYKLLGSMKEQPRKLCFVCGRQGNSITLLLVNEIATAKVMVFTNEFAQIKTRDGCYNLFPNNIVTDLQDVADVCDIIRNAPDEA